LALPFKDTPRIYFSRHGETLWNAEERVQGQFDTDLSAKGQGQADGNGIVLKSLVPDPRNYEFVASPLKRTRETMERIRTGMGLDPALYRLEPQLLEVHFGDWQGFTIKEISMMSPELLDARHKDKWNFLPPGKDAESYALLAVRIEKWLRTVDRQTVCVTHGGVIRVLFHIVNGIAPGDAAEIEIVQDRVLKLENGWLDWVSV
jgi:broad specificity phosphatase PhoE